jgi:hypothetical protein
MIMRRTLWFSVATLGLGGLAMALPGCGGGGSQEVSSTGEVKIVQPPDASKDSPPVQEEYKNLSPAGKAAK